MFFRIVIFLISLSFLLGWRMIAEPAGWGIFPIGAIMLLPLIYFSWRSTLFFCLPLALLWESTTPLSLGEFSIPLTVGCLFLQLLARHQLRTNFITQMFAAVLLQSIVTITFGLMFPPKTIAGVVLQMTQTLGQLFFAGIFSILWVWMVRKLAYAGFDINLEQAVKQL